MDKQEILKYIEELIKEHEESNYCCSYENAVDESSHFHTTEDMGDRFYDAGRYEALLEVHRHIKEMNNELVQ